MKRCVPPHLIWAAALYAAWVTMRATPVLAEKTDRIYIADTVIIGEVKSLERGRLKISTDYMGTVEADWKQVTRVESKKWFEIELASGKRHFGFIVASDEDCVLAVDGAAEATERLPFSDVVLINQTEAGLWGKVDFDLALGFSFVQATDNFQGSLTGNVTRRTDRFFSRLHLLSVLSRTDDESFTRNDLSYTALRALPGRWTYELSAQFQSNESLGLEQRYLLQGGPLYRVLRTDIRELTLGAGLAAVRENYVENYPEENSWEGVLGLRYLAFHFDDPELRVSTTLLTYPSLTASGRWRTEFKMEVGRELGWDLFWSLNAYWSYDNRPVGEVSKNSDLTFTASLGWSP